MLVHITWWGSPLMSKSYYIDFGNSRIYLSESPDDFAHIVDTVFLNTWLITEEDLDNLVGYLSIRYPNVTLEHNKGSTTFLMCVDVAEVPTQGNLTIGNQ